MIVIASERDGLAVRRDDGRKVRAFAAGQGTDRLVGELDRVDFAFDGLHVALIIEIAGGKQRIIVEPGHTGEAAIGISDLARGAAIGRQDEDLAVAVLKIACAIKAVGKVVEDLDRRIPFGAFGLFDGFGEARLLIGDEHGEGDKLAIGRPLRAGWSLFELGKREAVAAIDIEQAQFRLAIV